jgi:hypothetical protein
MRKIYMVGLAALAALGIACGSGGGEEGEKNAAAPAEQQQGGKATTAAKVPGLKTAVRDGKFEFTVTKFDCSLTKIGNDVLSTKAQGKFCLAHMTVKNIGKEAQMFDASSQKALDADGTVYEADGGAAIYVNENSETFLNNINPGNQTKGVIPFDVPKNVTVVTLELHDSPFSEGVKVKVG